MSKKMDSKKTDSKITDSKITDSKITDSKITLTTANGAPIADNQNSRTAGPQGPVIIDDYQLVEKLAHFNRENIPERRVHAKGSGAYGLFTVTQDITKYSCADLFSEVGKETAVFVRFSTVGGERGSSDTARDPRGFAVKFYTQQGNWDIVGNNTPVFFIRDAIKFPDFIHTQKRDPKTNLKDPHMMWDFWSQSPESLHQITILFSDRGIPRSYRYMNGYGSHTYSVFNQQAVRYWIKWHFKTLQGIENTHPNKAKELDGVNPDSAQDDLYHTIEKKDFPKWRLCCQIMTEEQANIHKENPFDVTKVWSQKDYPLIEVGIMELNRNPENYFAEVEQAAFAPSNLVPGVGLSPDKMLQGRIFAYADAQRYRIGTNYQQLPVNAPKCPYHNYQRDGAMRFDGNSGSAPNYEPNSFIDAPKQDPRFAEPPLTLKESIVDRHDHHSDTDYYSQPRALFQLMNSEQKQLLINNIVESLKTVDKVIQLKQVKLFYKVIPAYGTGIAEGLDLAVEQIK